MRCHRVQARPGSSLMAMMEASLEQRWRFRGNDAPRKQRKTLLTIMTSTFKWIVVHELKSKLGYGRSWQTFPSAGRPCFCSCFSLRDRADNSIVAPESDYRRWWFLNEQEGQIKNAHIKATKGRASSKCVALLRQRSASSSVVTVHVSERVKRSGPCFPSLPPSAHQHAAEPKADQVTERIPASSVWMNDFKLVRFDDKYLFIVLQITYFTGLP